MVRRFVRAVLSCCLAGLVAVSCSTASPPVRPPGSASVATTGAPATRPIPKLGVSGTSLTLDGKPVWPIGINAYQLATNW